MSKTNAVLTEENTALIEQNTALSAEVIAKGEENTALAAAVDELTASNKDLNEKLAAAVAAADGQKTTRKLVEPSKEAFILLADVTCAEGALEAGDEISLDPAQEDYYRNAGLID
jgi:hypothetical protein